MPLTTCRGRQAADPTEAGGTKSVTELHPQAPALAAGRRKQLGSLEEQKTITPMPLDRGEAHQE